MEKEKYQPATEKIEKAEDRRKSNPKGKGL